MLLTKDANGDHAVDDNDDDCMKTSRRRRRVLRGRGGWGMRGIIELSITNQDSKSWQQ